MGHYIALIALTLLGLSLVYVFLVTIKGRPVERRIVFIYIALTASLPLFVKLTPPVRVSGDVRILVDQLEALPPNSKVVAAFDYDPPSEPELQPMAEAFMKYAFKNDLKVIVMGLWPPGPQQANMAIDTALADPEVAAKNLEYGVDYVNLGFQSGNEFVIQSMGTSFKSMFPQDDRRIPYDSLPLLRNVVNFSNVDFVMNFSSGKPGTDEWVQIAADRFSAKLGAGNTAVQAPMMKPYVRAGQLLGLLGGMSGAAEFEKALNEPGKATVRLLSQIFAHAAVILFIIIGNFAFIASRRKARNV